MEHMKMNSVKRKFEAFRLFFETNFDKSHNAFKEQYENAMCELQKLRADNKRREEQTKELVKTVELYKNKTTQLETQNHHLEIQNVNLEIQNVHLTKVKIASEKAMEEMSRNYKLKLQKKDAQDEAKHRERERKIIAEHATEISKIKNECRESLKIAEAKLKQDVLTKAREIFQKNSKKRDLPRNRTPSSKPSTSRAFQRTRQLETPLKCKKCSKQDYYKKQIECMEVEQRNLKRQLIAANKTFYSPKHVEKLIKNIEDLKYQIRLKNLEIRGCNRIQKEMLHKTEKLEEAKFLPEKLNAILNTQLQNMEKEKETLILDRDYWKEKTNKVQSSTNTGGKDKINKIFHLTKILTDMKEDLRQCISCKNLTNFFIHFEELIEKHLSSNDVEIFRSRFWDGEKWPLPDRILQHHENEKRNIIKSFESQRRKTSNSNFIEIHEQSLRLMDENKSLKAKLTDKDIELKKALRCKVYKVDCRRSKSPQRCSSGIDSCPSSPILRAPPPTSESQNVRFREIMVVPALTDKDGLSDILQIHNSKARKRCGKDSRA